MTNIFKAKYIIGSNPTRQFQMSEKKVLFDDNGVQFTKTEDIEINTIENLEQILSDIEQARLTIEAKRTAILEEIETLEEVDQPVNNENVVEEENNNV
jgi:hypothetical protein